jgi:hypothetical protein
MATTKTTAKAAGKTSKVTQSQFISVRVSTDHAEMFAEKSTKFGGMSAVLRELIEGFNENRVTIKPSSNRKDIYSIGK